MSATQQAVRRARRVALAITRALPDGILADVEEAVSSYGGPNLTSVITKALGDNLVELPPEPAWDDGMKVPLVRTVVERRITARNDGVVKDAPAQAAIDDCVNTSRPIGNVVEHNIQEVDAGLRSIIANAVSALADLHETGRLPISDGFGDFDTDLKRIQRAREAAATIDAVHSQAYAEARRRES